MEWKRSRDGFIFRTPLFYCVSTCLLSVCALLSTTGARTVCPDFSSSSVRKADCYFQEFDKLTARKVQQREEEEGEEEEMSSTSLSRTRSYESLTLESLRLVMSTRRYLSGPGSYPPRCTSKCGKCTPCKPVHVPVPPGTRAPAEYYPEAWRCKCGNRLYMP